MILRIEARYQDGEPRALAFHLNLRPSFDFLSKAVKLKLPPAAEVLAHPGAAFIPVAEWFHGLERERRTSPTAFWIDIRPPTVDAYLQVADELLAEGRLAPENSFVLTARNRSAAIDATGLGQLRSLSKDLGEIFGKIEAGAAPHVAAPSDIVVGAGALPCPQCPAPMTRLEAQIFCEAKGKRLPTDLEWELAVRGVDGRVFPWGNQLDQQRANLPGLPQKGELSPALKPVDAYPAERSPFGLIDTVGNAGDWVTNESGAYERIYMGATYRYSPEDATAFRSLPVTDEDYLVREITARCVSN